MGQTFFRELRAARRSFAALAMLLLALPVLLSTLPRPALAAAMAEISGFSICSTMADGSTRPAPVSPCESCMPGAICATAAIAEPTALFAVLLPQRQLLGALDFDTPAFHSKFYAAILRVRGPPSLS